MRALLLEVSVIDSAELQNSTVKLENLWEEIGKQLHEASNIPHQRNVNFYWIRRWWATREEKLTIPPLLIHSLLPWEINLLIERLIILKVTTFWTEWFEDNLYQETSLNESTQNQLQIFHYWQWEHWITATTIGCNDGMVKVYDSIY